MVVGLRRILSNVVRVRSEIQMRQGRREGLEEEMKVRVKEEGVS